MATQLTPAPSGRERFGWPRMRPVRQALDLFAGLLSGDGRSPVDLVVSYGSGTGLTPILETWEAFRSTRTAPEPWGASDAA